MKIREDSWHFRLYVFMSQWNAAWRYKDDYLAYPKIGSSGIGLCPYMRMILIWGPLAIVSNVVPIFAVVAAFLIFPGSMNGAAGVGWLLFSISVIIGLGFIISWIKDWSDERAERREGSQLKCQDPDYVEPDSFWKLLKAFAQTTKSKICPVLELEK